MFHDRIVNTAWVVDWSVSLSLRAQWREVYDVITVHITSSKKRRFEIQAKKDFEIHAKKILKSIQKIFL